MRRIGVILECLLISVCLPSLGQTHWVLTTAVQYLNGVSLTTPGVKAYLLNFGTRYVGETFSVSGSLPLVWINTSSESQATSGSMMSMNSFMPGLGDFFLNGLWEALPEGSLLPALNLNPQVKIPTATRGIGSGQFDFGINLGLRKTAGGFMAFIDFGKQKLGDPDGFTYEDPWTYGAGLGKIFFDGKFSALLYYQGATPTLATSESPSQLALGINMALTTTHTLSLFGSRGLSSASPDYGVLLGLQINL